MGLSPDSLYASAASISQSSWYLSACVSSTLRMVDSRPMGSGAKMLLIWSLCASRRRRVMSLKSVRLLDSEI
ncbi:hypothetical protein D3C79_1063130 [compost metagenome]